MQRQGKDNNIQVEADDVGEGSALKYDSNVNTNITLLITSRFVSCSREWD